MRRALILGLISLLLTSCADTPDQDASDAASTPVPESTDSAEASPSSTPTSATQPSSIPTSGPQTSASQTPATVTDFSVTPNGEFNEGWALEFLPGTDYLLISERVGNLQLRDQRTGQVRQVQGTPEVYHQGQAGMHDVIAAPSFQQDGKIFLSWVSPDGGPHGVVASAILDTENAALRELTPIWQQDPATGDGHFSLRLLAQGQYLFVTSGERQKGSPAQDLETNLGKVLRFTLDGKPAAGNPFDGDGVTAQLYTMGHRNLLGIAQDSRGQVWVSEMGPQGGDELNLLVAGANYGWPNVSNGSNYDGSDIPDHSPGDGYEAPKAWWNPSISPGGLTIYRGELFSGWEDSALLAGLSGKTLVRVQLRGDEAEIAQSWDMGERIRAVEVAPDGTIWLLEDEAGGRLLQLKPTSLTIHMDSRRARQ